jgi:hypothetical protein
MVIYNKTTQSYPLIVHAQGSVHDTNEWLNIVKSCPATSNLPTDVTLLTFLSGDLDFSLPKQLSSNGIKFLNAVDTNNKWQNSNKIIHLANVLKKITTPYVMCMDGLDTLCAADLHSLIDRFLTFNADIVYNASKINYPSICPFSEDTKSGYKYLNAGVFIGRTMVVRAFYKFLYETQFNKTYYGSEGKEQIRVRHGRAMYKKATIKVDTECLMFQTLNKSKFTYDGNVLRVQN